MASVGQRGPICPELGGRWGRNEKRLYVWISEDEAGEREGPGHGRDLGVYLKSRGSHRRKMNGWRREVQHLDMCLVSSARLVVPDLCEGDGTKWDERQPTLMYLYPQNGGKAQITLRYLQNALDNTLNVR